MTAERPAHLHLSARYEVLRELGAGGMGRVLLVRDAYLRKDLALKLLHESPEPEDLEQLKKEFALLAGIDHPGIARAHDFGYAGGRPFFTREYVPGTPLREKGPRAGRTAFLEMARHLAEALAFLHRSGILHLDIKPGNIIVRGRAKERRPVLIDFGLFRQGLPAAAGVKLRGSLPYMAPEYFRSDALGPWTDVYALGVTLYRTATGSYPRRPPAGRDAAGSGPAASNGAWEPVLPPLSRLAPALGEDVQSIVLKCLAIDPEARFASATELLRAMESVLGARSRPQVPPSPFPRTVGRAAELAAIDSFLDGVGAACPREEGRPSLLLLTGPRGMGQTHLLRELKLRAQTRGLSTYLERGHEGARPAPGAPLRCLEPHLETGARRRWSAFLSALRRPPGRSEGEASHAERRLRRGAEVASALSFLREPVVLAMDGLQFMDEITVEILTLFAEALARGPPGARPPLGLALGYREEGPAAHLLRDLTVCILEARKGVIIPLVPLGPRETLELFHGKWKDQPGAATPDGVPVRDGLDVFQKTSGIPSRIIDLAAAALERDEGKEPEGRSTSDRAAASRGDRDLLSTLALLRKPVKPSVLARLLDLSPGNVTRRLSRLAKADLVREDDASPGPGHWMATASVDGPSLSLAGKRRIHAAIAREILRTKLEEDDPRLMEAVHHAHAAGRKTIFLRHAPRLARYLKMTYQNRAALELLHRIKDALPPRSALRQAQAALEIAEIHGRVGDLDRGIELLRDIIERARRLPEPWRARLLLRLATLHSRRGDFRQAESLFTAGLRGRRQGSKRARLGRDEFLFFLNEHAAMKAFVGEGEEAQGLCEEGLRLAGRMRGGPARDLLLNFHATRANIALRKFEFDDAIRDFEEALRTAEAAGSLVNRAVVLNNLGIVYSQCDRYREAIESFEAARTSCLELDEGPSLSFVYGNLALLYSKTGDFAAMDRVLLSARSLDARKSSRRPGSGGFDMGPREELFHEHHQGVALIHRGRYDEARPHLEAAIRLGTTIGDRLAKAFDEVYRAEALIFTADYAGAERELRRISRAEGPKRLRLMALSRQAYLCALTAREDEMAAALREHELIEAERPVAFLDAWDDIFLGWALSIAGLHERAMERIDRAEDYFRRSGLRPAAGLAGWVRAEAHFLRGDTAAARNLLESSSPSSDLLLALEPLLAGRCLLESAAGDAEMERAADLLVEAGAALVGNRLPEWAHRLEALRAAFHGGGRGGADLEKERRSISRGLPEAAREGYHGSGHWRIWTERFDRDRVRHPTTLPGKARSLASRSRLAAVVPLSDASSTSRTIALRGRGHHARAGVVAHSAAMRSLLGALDRLRESELPVVISGETGTGKDLVARILHAESPRFAGPFRVLDCATIPVALLEVELFGARKGAFSDLEEDRSGLLAQAAGGTLLVDGIGGASLELQSKLLRVLSAGSFRPVGGDAETRADVRFLFSSSRDLEDERRQGRLREDLFHRIRVLTLDVPPLRKRIEDIEGLVGTFLREGDGPRPELAPGVIDELRSLEWPGNVRELKNLVARLRFEHADVIPLDAVRGAGMRQSAASLIPRRLLTGESLAGIQDLVERDYLLFHIRRLRGDVGALSRLLGLSLTHSYRRLKQLGIDVRKERRRDPDA